MDLVDSGLEEEYSEVVYVNRGGDFRQLFQGFPGAFHTGRPMDVGDYENGVFGGAGQELVDVVQGGLFAVVTIEEKQVQGLAVLALGGLWPLGALRWGLRVGLLIEPGLEKVDVGVEAGTGAGFNKSFLGKSSDIGVAFHGIQAGMCVGGMEIKGGDAGVGAEFQDIFGFQPDGESEEEPAASVIDGVGGN